jgi:hypothetical protein
MGELNVFFCLVQTSSLSSAVLLPLSRVDQVVGLADVTVMPQ